MNQKGFTLVEVLATIVLISILGVIAYTSVTSYIKNSKQKAEDKFLSDIENQIDSYIALNSAQFRIVKLLASDGNSCQFTKEMIQSSGTSDTSSGTSETNSWMKSRDVYVYSTEIQDVDKKFTFEDLIDGLKMTDKFQNPNTSEICDNNIEIEVYKDSDYVYYYYVNMTASDIGCTATKDIDTRPDNLKNITCCKDINGDGYCE